LIKGKNGNNRWLRIYYFAQNKTFLSFSIFHA
jgi:hypothetical protein